MNHGHKEYLICQEHNCYGLSKFPKYEENGTCPKCELEQLRAKVAELEAKLEKYENLEPVAYRYTVDCCGVDEDMFAHPEGYYPSDAIPLYALEK